MYDEAHVSRRFVLWQDCRVDRLLHKNTDGMSLLSFKVEAMRMVWKSVWPDEPRLDSQFYSRIALESGGDKEKFWQIFNERMNTLKVPWLPGTKATPANAPISTNKGLERGMTR